MRSKTSRKGDNGRVLIIGGSIDYAGAPALSGIAAFRTGVDLVTIAAPSKVSWAINSMCPDLITKKLKGDFLDLKHYKIIKELIERNDVILIGNGIGTNKKTKLLVKRIVKEVNKPLIIDADALKMITIDEVKNCILTPHRGELGSLLKNSGIKNIKILKKKLNESSIVLAKGPTDTIISKNKVIKIKGGSSGMTVAGTGDILAGLCAGYLAQKMTLFDSAKKASSLNKKVGEKLEKKYGYNFIASDFLLELAKPDY